MPDDIRDGPPRFSLASGFRAFTVLAVLLGLGITLGGRRLLAEAAEVLVAGLALALVPIGISLAAWLYVSGLRRLADAVFFVVRWVLGKPVSRSGDSAGEASSPPADSAD